jgi:2-polyprenyl-3-methyl-5-hydroxy-6-metoxy-1,4-benzoquinol methylase
MFFCTSNMEFLTGTCPICEATETHEAGTVLGRDERDYEVLRCAHCGLLFVSPFPRLSQEDYERIYDANYYAGNWGDEGHGYFDRQKIECMHSEAELQRRAIENETGIVRGSILDVGCGDGRYLQAFAAAGWQAVGIEVSPAAVNRAQPAAGVEVIHGSFDSVNLGDRSFDVVRLKHCIEHLSCPRETLASIQRLLRPGGFLVLDTDNAESLRSRCERFAQRTTGPLARWVVRGFMGKDLRKRFGRLSPPIHLLYFSPCSLRHAVESVGLRVERIFSVHHGHPVWFPLVHPYRCHPLEAAFRVLDRLGAAIGRGEAIVCFASKPNPPRGGSQTPSHLARRDM